MKNAPSPGKRRGGAKPAVLSAREPRVADYQLPT
jgi:hypothetical protein